MIPSRILIHLYEDGAFNRRELISRLTKYTGSMAAATALVESTGLAQSPPAAGCLTDVRVVRNRSCGLVADDHDSRRRRVRCSSINPFRGITHPHRDRPSSSFMRIAD